MSFEVAVIGGDAVGAIEYSEEIGQQVDQHSTGRGEGDATRTSDAE
jgi:hypothetical protein